MISLGRRYDPERQQEQGLRGERFVCSELSGELSELGRDDLAAGVRRVSALSDQLGYDVVAPRVDSGHRRIEVKTSKRVDNGLAAFFLSRNEFGGVIHPQRLTEWFAKHREAAGIPTGTLHSLRHTAASLALTSGVPVHIVAARLGDDPTTVLSTYAHLLPQSDELAAERVAAAIA